MLGQHSRDFRLAVVLSDRQGRYAVFVASVDESGVGLNQFPNAFRIPGPNRVKEFLQGRTSWAGRNTESVFNTSQPR